MSRFSTRGDPRWLESLAGESSLLPPSQYEFVRKVRSLVERGMTGGGDVSPATRHALRHHLPDLADDFVRIVERLRASAPSRFEFLETYWGWKVYRENTIRKLKKIADAVDKDKENCDIARIFGSSMSLLGEGISLMSSKKEQNAAQVIGSVLMGIGNLTTAGTSVVGTLLLHESVRATKEILAEDKRCMEKMLTCMTDTPGLLGTLQGIESLGVDSRLESAARSLLEVSGSSADCMQTEVQTILKSLDCPPDLRQGIADALGLLLSAFMICDRYRPVFHVAVEACKCLPRLRTAHDLFQSAGGFGTALSVRRSPGLTHAQKKKVVQGMAVDAANIVLTAFEMDKESADGARIRQAACRLEEEAETFDNLYHGMKELNDLERQRVEHLRH